MKGIASRADLVAALDRVQSWFSGKIGLAAINLATGETVEVDADRLYPTASVIKLAVLVELFRQAAGRLDLDKRVEMAADDVVLGSGVLKELRPGLAPTVRDLATAMVVLSDNTATNMLIDLVGGVEPVNATMRDRLGLPNILLHRRIDFGQIGPDIRRFGESTPRDMARLVAGIARGEVIDADASAAMLDILRRQQYLNQVPRYLNFNPHADALGEEQSIWVCCKTGMTPGIRADAGVVHLPGDVEIAYCAMTEESADRAMAEEAEGEVANGLIGRLLVDYWWPGGAPPGALRDSAWVGAVLG